LDGADDGIAYWDFRACEVRRQSIVRGRLRAVHDANLTVALLDHGQVDGVWLKFVDLLKPISGH
jgi:hypothetical protein